MPRRESWSIPCIGFILLILCWAPASHAQTEVSGRYKCAEAKVDGKAVPCQSAPLILKENGQYEILGREGNYQITGEWLVLSERSKHARAKIAPGHRLVFQYTCGKGSCEVMFERRTAELGKTSLS
jgi:hypothetical protein